MLKSRETGKGAEWFRPIKGSLEPHGMNRNKAISFLQEVATQPNEASSHNDANESARENLRVLLEPISGEHSPNRSTSNDLESLKRIVASVADAGDAGILSQSEADTVIDFVVRRFIERRLTKVIQTTLAPPANHWFSLNSGSPTYGTRSIRTGFDSSSSA